MQSNDEWPRDFDSEAHSNRSRPSSRKNSLTKPSQRKSTQKSPPLSSQSTPKKSALRPEKCDFLVSGRQILKRSDRANSLPGGYSRRPSLESLKGRKSVHSTKIQGFTNVAETLKNRDTSLEDDCLDLDLSQVSEFEEQNSKHGSNKRFAPQTTSTPKQTPKVCQKRSGSMQTQKILQKMDLQRDQSFDSCKYSSVSLKTSSTNSNYRAGCSTELDYSSVSPEYSAPSSADVTPRTPQPSEYMTAVSPHRSASSCYISWLDSDRTQSVRPPTMEHDGEWASFWANYNGSLSRVPMMKNYYDQCPTPYRTETIDLADLDITAHESARTPDHLQSINHVIRTEGLHLTPRETQNLIKCAHMLGNVLSKAIDRNARLSDVPPPFDRNARLSDVPPPFDRNARLSDVPPPIDRNARLSDGPPPFEPPEATMLDQEVELKKKALTLELKEQNKPMVVEELRTSETVTTQTDISLPNTKSAPKIFEKILRQLSKSSIEEVVEKKKDEGSKEVNEAAEAKVESSQPTG